jgi:dihydrofolate synthase / folylpolyglutamate synthase
MQKLALPVTTIVDVAHNPHAAQFLADRLQELQPAAWHAVVGMLADKDISGTLAPLLPLIHCWYLTDFAVAHGAQAQQLNQALCQLGAKHIHCFSTPRLAYQQAAALAGQHEAIIVFGSFHTVADVLSFADERTQTRD